MPSAISDHASAAKREPSATFRTDIEGLRAFAVGLVVLDHLFGWPDGGFVGVDVFYVLSGFLITGLLLREHARSGWISFSSFYARRVRRIVPAAVLVLVATTIAAYVIWYTPQANQTLLDSISALFFVANWHFIAAGTDYLHAAGPVSPVQHFWSLSVEEQFYVAWPWLILLLLVSAGRQMKRRGTYLPSQRGLVVVIVAVIVATFAWSVFTTRQAPEAAYFDTFARVWELAAGALLAVLAPQMRRIPPHLGRWFAWGGLALLLLGAYFIDPGWAFPGPWAVVPVLATMMIIVGGASGHSIVALDNPISRHLGKVSYSLYLWHWPVIVFVLAVTPNPNPIIYLVMIGLMMALAELSYHFVEDRILKSRWLRPDPAARQRRGLQLVGAATVGVIIIGLSVAQLRGPAVLVDAEQIPIPDRSSAQPRTWTASELTSAVADAADSTQWPADLSPSLSTLNSSNAATHMDKVTGCRNTVGDVGDPMECVRPGTADMIAVVGDSVALSWVPAIETAYPEATVVALGYGSCPAVPAKVGPDHFAAECSDAQARMLSWTAEQRADLVFTSSAQANLAWLGADRNDEWAASATDYFQAYGAIAGRAIMIGNPPVGEDPRKCVTRFTGPSSCASELSSAWEEKAAAESGAAAAAGGAYVGVRDWFCDAGGVCPVFTDGVITRIDSVHLTDLEARSLGGVLRDAVNSRP